MWSKYRFSLSHHGPFENILIVRQVCHSSRLQRRQRRRSWGNKLKVYGAKRHPFILKAFTIKRNFPSWLHQRYAAIVFQFHKFYHKIFLQLANGARNFLLFCLIHSLLLLCAFFCEKDEWGEYIFFIKNYHSLSCGRSLAATAVSCLLFST